MDLYDQHVHSKHSFDSEAEPAACVDSAIARGLRGLTFTEHFDTHPDEWESCAYDDHAYTTTIEELRSRFGDRIFIGKGIEVCFQPDRMDFILDFLQQHRFDLVMLSVHFFGAHPVHARKHWEGLTVAEGTKRYLETVLEAVRFCEEHHRTHSRVFDILAHLDFVKRYSHRFLGSFDVGRFDGLVNDILRTCIAADIVPEVNTSTLRQQLGEPMPSAEVVARYAGLGGTAMSIGSDAHRAEDVGAGFDQARTILRGAGISRIPIFRNREKETTPV